MSRVFGHISFSAENSADGCRRNARFRRDVLFRYHFRTFCVFVDIFRKKIILFVGDRITRRRKTCKKTDFCPYVSDDISILTYLFTVVNTFSENFSLRKDENFFSFATGNFSLPSAIVFRPHADPSLLPGSSGIGVRAVSFPSPSGKPLLSRGFYAIIKPV